MKNIFIFDKNKCVGCGACKVACVNENGKQEPEQWRNIYTVNSIHNPHLALIHLSLACNHCDDSPCLVNCPALAYTKDDLTGAVIHNEKKCIGCKYCTWTCPFDAPKYIPKAGVVNKCTWCSERIKDGLKPACANLCPTGALDFSNQDFSREDAEKSSPVKVSIGSNIKIVELRNEKPPEMDINLFNDDNFHYELFDLKDKISAIKEWPLVIFTYIMAVFVALTSSNIIENKSDLIKIVFITSGIVASLFSMLHLGKKMRSWRSILNIKNSWLSREILAFSSLMCLLITNFFIIPIPEFLIRLAGLLLLISIDMLYTKAMWRWPINIHSGQTLLIATGIFLLLTMNIQLIIGFYIIRVALNTFFYVKRKNQNILILLMQLLILTTGIFIYFRLDMQIGLMIVLIYDLFDRIDFYNQLSLPVIADELKRV